MTIQIYHNPRCSKSRQTLALLEEKLANPEQDIEIIRYLDTPPNAEQLKSVLQKLGISARELLRTKENEYKENGLDNQDLSDNEIIATMIRYPKLIERPIVINGGQARIGRPPEQVLEILDV